MQSDDLSKFLKEIGLKNDYNIEEDLGEGFVKLKISEAERRQALQDISSVEDVVVELLRNSRDAGSDKIFLATKKADRRYRNLNCIDNGRGIPPKFHKVIFSSRVTSKLEDGKKDYFGFHGRGMALFSIKLNVEEVKITFSDLGLGSSFYANIDLEKLPEKKDQSSLPSISRTDDSHTVTSGVHNIIRTVTEFQLQNPHIDFYYGNQTQILATMRHLAGNNLVTIKDRLNVEKIHQYLSESKKSVIDIAGLAYDYNVLSHIAEEIYGMDISERNIQRVVYGEIEPLRPLRDQISLLALDSIIEEREQKKVEKESSDDRAKKLSLKDEQDISKIFTEEDIEDIKKFIENIINKIGKKYFITTNNDIKCYKKENILRFTVELKQKD